MVQTLVEYARETFSGVFTNSLFVAVLYGMIVVDLRRMLGVDKVINKVKFLPLKILLLLFSYVILIIFGLIMIFCVVALLWVIGEIL